MNTESSCREDSTGDHRKRAEEMEELLGMSCVLWILCCAILSVLWGCGVEGNYKVCFVHMLWLAYVRSIIHYNFCRNLSMKGIGFPQ